MESLFNSAGSRVKLIGMKSVWHTTIEYSNLCHFQQCNKGKCFQIRDHAYCECPVHTKGEFCEVIDNLCDPNPCWNSGVCSQTGLEYSCTCTSEWTGERCNEFVPTAIKVIVNGDGENLNISGIFYALSDSCDTGFMYQEVIFSRALPYCFNVTEEQCFKSE